jgi:hypothetical protein
VLAWNDALNAILSAQGVETEGSVDWKLRRERLKVLILGPSGAGKTEILAQLTGKTPGGVRSDTPETGYRVLRNTPRRMMELTAVPGHVCGRGRLMDDLFRNTSLLEGAIFVACFGFNYIWPGSVPVIAENLRTSPSSPAGKPGLSDLRDRNAENELRIFRELCRRLRTKWDNASNLGERPRWLLILVNKIDLYASSDELEAARTYYRPDGAIGFGRVLENELRAIQEDAGFNIRLLPALAHPKTYEFDHAEDFAGFSTASELDIANRWKAVQVLSETLEELCGTR